MNQTSNKEELDILRGGEADIDLKFKEARQKMLGSSKAVTSDEHGNKIKKYNKDDKVDVDSILKVKKLESEFNQKFMAGEFTEIHDVGLERNLEWEDDDDLKYQIEHYLGFKVQDHHNNNK